MKATLHFNLDYTDDELNHYRCIKSLHMALFIFDFSNKMRQLVDRSEDGKYIDEKHLFEAWEDAMQAYDLNIDRLVI